MGLSQDNDSGRTREEVAGVPIADLVKEFGTPLFVYDASVIRSRLAELRRFDVVRYAQKACSNLAVVDLLRRGNALVDAVSAGEIHRALAAGYEPSGDPPPIVYTADIFDHDALELVIARNIHVNCGSRDMIEQYGERVSGREITLRVNPGFGHGHSRKTNTGGDLSKHGIWHTQLHDALVEAEHYGLSITGIHMHIGSGTDLEHLAQVCSAMERAALEAGRNVRSISAGGGLPVPYRREDSRIDLAAYFELWDGTRRRLEEAFGHAVRLEIEPGRYLVAEAGYLICEIRAIKQQGDNWFYLTDAGFNNLARPILYGAYHPISLAPREPRLVREWLDAVVGGPLCESGDIFTQEEGGFVAKRRLPVAAVGDHLVIEIAGAYGFVMGSNYNSKPYAAEVLVTDGKPRLVRRRQTYEELLAWDVLPDQIR
ncbi:MAG: diaminopimelate decarboxylase [Thermogutta sp.]